MLPPAGMLRWWRVWAVYALLQDVRCPILAPLSALEREILLSREGTSRSFDVSCITHVEPCLGKLALSCLVRVSLFLLLRGLLRSGLAIAEQIVRESKAGLSAGS